MARGGSLEPVFIASSGLRSILGAVLQVTRAVQKVWKFYVQNPWIKKRCSERQLLSITFIYK